MILNLRPLEMGLLDCVVEECDMRFSAEEQEGILRVVREVLNGGGGEGEGMRVQDGVEDGENGHGNGNVEEGEGEGGEA